MDDETLFSSAPYVLVSLASPQRQWSRPVPLKDGMTIAQAIERSGLLTLAPEIDLSVQRVGIYGKLKGLDTVVRDKDRVEIYRPLVADPMESRRKRAEHRARRSKP
jgi:putative ubiquitin-RnfH superfamily antitoxin RatB of RatAB toxin-antitoxin module